MARTTLLTVLGLVIGLGVGQLTACGEQSDDPRAITTCRSYCVRSNECDETNMAECEENCRQIVGDCMDDEVDPALDRLTSCSNEACNEFTECTVSAGLDCIFGI
jgi:hypothetical protein